MAAFCAAGAIAGLIMTAPSALAEPDIPSPPAAADGVPHLSSPENLPPGTADAPAGPPEAHGLSYLRELWHAVQTQDISGKDAAILLLTQRPMDPNAAPPPGVAAGPQQQAPPAPAPQVPN
ncbi:MAG: hypothetical protein QOE41_1699 [Mycobacterium sp.]|jgi:hypothetical protein|nr:hypothetical protein [Mycobacterium sp.]MDT5132388.1 hypothetical protein [Mycobacterium sp.]